MPDEQPQNSSEKLPDSTQGKEGELPRLRTMKYDAAKYLKDKEVSFLDLVAKEKEKNRAEEFDFRERGPEQVWIRVVIGLVILVFLSVGGYAAYIYLATRDNLPAEEARPARSFIPTDEREIITVRAGDRAGLFSKLEAARRDRLPSGSIKHVVVRIEKFGGESHFATTEELMSLFDYKPPADLPSNLSEVFNILIYYRPNGASLGFIFESKNYERALAQMLAWEDSIASDMRTLYFDSPPGATSQSFVDKIVKNIDVRRLDLADGQSLSYGFYTRRYLLISTADDLLEVMINRFLVSPPR